MALSARCLLNVSCLGMKKTMYINVGNVVGWAKESRALIVFRRDLSEKFVYDMLSQLVLVPIVHLFILPKECHKMSLI